jgi:hypothetical protein
MIRRLHFISEALEPSKIYVLGRVGHAMVNQLYLSDIIP